MSKFKYLGGGILVGSVAILGFLLLTQETKIDQLKRETNNKAKEITITAFVEMMLKNPDITIDDAILKFENVQDGISLGEFAESKTRTRENYISAYRKYFDKAHEIVF